MQLKDILNYHLCSSLYRGAVSVDRAWYVVMFLAKVINNNKNDILIIRLQKVSDEIYDNILSTFYKNRQ